MPRSVLAIATALLLASLIPPTLGAQAAPQEGPMTVESFDGTDIDILVCKPANASAAAPAPVILHSHGWGGSRASSCSGFSDWLRDGFGVVSISQRGFGASGGEAHVHDPDYEGRDNIAVIDRVASLGWVLLEGPKDPVMGAIGGSYGGGYQLITALTEIRATGSTRFDALAPEITWYDLPESLAPQDVVRSGWVAALYAAGAGAVHQGIHQAFAYGVATGNFPDGSVPGVYNVKDDFHGNSPVAFVEDGILLDVPALIGQGMTDNLFNLNQGWKNFERTLTPEARDASYFIGYNGGHALPSVLPMGTPFGAAVGTNTDPCSAPFGGFAALTRAFFKNVLLGEENAMPATPYLVATTEGACLGLQTLESAQPVALGDIVTTSGAGAPQHIPLMTGPATIAGIPFVHATMTSVGVEQRAFLALSKGTTPATALVLDNNMMPVRAKLPVMGEDVSVELAGVATTLAPGETLFLTVSPVYDMSFGHGSRAPGAILLEDVRVDVPVV